MQPRKSAAAHPRKRHTVRFDPQRLAQLKQWAQDHDCSINGAFDYAVSLLLGPEPHRGKFYATAVDQILREINTRHRSATQARRTFAREQRALRDQQIHADSSKGETLQTLAHRFGMSRQRIHQIILKRKSNPL